MRKELYFNSQFNSRIVGVFFSKMYENNPFKIVDDKQSQQYKWLLNIVYMEKLIEKNLPKSGSMLQSYLNSKKKE